METSLPYRVVRLEGEEWIIRPDEGELPHEEKQALKAFLKEAGLSCRFDQGKTCIPGGTPWDFLEEKLIQFYQGRAEVIPF